MQQLKTELRSNQRKHEQEFSAALTAKEAQQRELRSRLEEVITALKEHESLLEEIRAERDQLLLTHAHVHETQAAAVRQVRLAEEERNRQLDQEKYAHMTTQLQARDREIALESEHAMYVKALASMQRAMDEKQAEVTRRESQVRWLETACEALKQEIADSESIVEREKARCEQMVADADDRLEDMSIKLDHAQKELDGLKKQLSEKDSQLKVLEKRVSSQQQRTAVAKSTSEYESRLHTMAEHLIQKQSQMELLTSQKQALQLQLEDAVRRAREAEMRASSNQRSNVQGMESDVSSASKGPRQRNASKFVKTVEAFELSSASRLRKPAEAMDVFSFHMGNVLRSSPAARVFLLFYVLVLHLWILFILSSWQSMETTDSREPRALDFPLPSRITKTD
mmetsp:Transcript_32853/g.53309  ORF Transcript_32853/g.53309 Transcript_32853/m.53309 type:complete len:397 (+) Transcript_32853:220-1410(+)